MLKTRAAAYHKPVAEIGSMPARKEVRQRCVVAVLPQVR